MAAAMQELTFWCDIGCIDGSDVPRKMYILKSHLQDFCVFSNYVMILMSTHYFSRLWCIFEFCCACKLRKDLNTVIVSNACLAFFESERDKIQGCIQSISVKGSTCFDLADRALIENKITLEYKSFAHFERFSKFAAIAMCAKSAVFPAIECYSSWLTDWADCAVCCGYDELAKKLYAVDTVGLREKVFSNVPDNPAETQCLQRSNYVEEVFAREWFEMELAPMIAAERKAAITGG
jgi:hypothetical protein